MVTDERVNQLAGKERAAATRCRSARPSRRSTWARERNVSPAANERVRAGQWRGGGLTAERRQARKRLRREAAEAAEARDRAACIVRSLIMGRDAEDWRDWVVHVSDDFDDEIFVLPFAFVLGKPH